MRVQFAFLSGVLIATFTAPSVAPAQQVEFRELGYLNEYRAGNGYGRPAAISADGSVVVGTSSNSDGSRDWGEAFRWSDVDGMVGLGFINLRTDGGRYSDATAISADGSVIVGASTNSDGILNWQEAFRWTEASGMIGLGYLTEHTSGYANSYASAISADGSAVVGLSTNSDGTANWYEAFHWTEATGIVGLGYLHAGIGGHRTSEIAAISYDGTIVAGWSTNSDGMFDWTEAFRWTATDGMVGLGYLHSSTIGPGYSSAVGISADGSTIVGRSSNSDGTSNWTEAFRWTDTDGMVGLGYLNEFINGSRDSSAIAISADGSTIVGLSSNSDGNDDWAEGFRWTATDGMIGLGSLYGTAYTAIPSSVSSDGSVIVGYGHNPALVGNEDFRWSTNGGMQSVADWLGPDVDLTGLLLGHTGLSDPPPSPLISADGTTITGTMTHADGSRTAYLARAGGLVTPDAAAASFGEIASLAVGLGNAVNASLASFESTARHLQCRTTDGKPTPYCVFGSIEGGGTIGSADNEFLSGTGTIGIATQGANGLSFAARIGGSYQTNDLALGGSAEVDRFETGLQLAYLPKIGPQVALSAVASTLSISVDRRYMNGAGTTVSSGDTDGWELGARAMLGWSFAAPIGRLTPYGSYTVTDIQLDGWSEASGPFPARFDDVSSTSQISRLGLEDEIQLTDRAAFWIDGAWAHSFGNNNNISGELVDLFEVGLPIGSGDGDWLEATAGLRYTVGEAAVIAGSVTIAAYPESETAAFGRLTFTKGF